MNPVYDFSVKLIELQAAYQKELLFAASMGNGQYVGMRYVLLYSYILCFLTSVCVACSR